jgi:inorganic pyrophosphatase
VPTEIAFEGSRKAIGAWIASDPTNRGPAFLRYACAGPAPPILVYAVIENPRGTLGRNTYDSARNSFSATGEVFPSPLPFHYGWIPHTLSKADGREIDVAVVGEGEAAVGSALAVRPVGALLRADGDHKIVALRADIPSNYVTVTDISERPELRDLVEATFRQRRPEVLGWATASEARRLILEAQRNYIGDHISMTLEEPER